MLYYCVSLQNIVLHLCFCLRRKRLYDFWTELCKKIIHIIHFRLFFLDLRILSAIFANEISKERKKHK